ncbi:RUS family member 1-like [Scyliorhinus torazame]|uniref:RUS family member 1-like n=1 Tax=Scyliorhinus torazame TaxID=75743 RepID=UPI003B5A5D8E
MAEEEAGLLCTERYSAHRSRRYFQLHDGQLLRRSERGTEATQSVADVFTSVFLPQGYPDSVSDDYVSYQIWDTVQAFASSITGTLATQAILKGVGVGDTTATVTAASITWILKDGTGMVGRILFAWSKGSTLDCDAKKWRLFADVLNDVAIFMEIVAPAFPPAFTLIVCVSGVFKSIVGVAGGATRAALTMHQARRDNMADVSAKDGSQVLPLSPPSPPHSPPLIPPLRSPSEVGALRVRKSFNGGGGHRVVQHRVFGAGSLGDRWSILPGLLVSLILTPLVAANIILTYLLYTLFTLLHLYANLRAVRAVVMDTLNQSRLRLLVTDFLRTGRVPLPSSINPREPVLPEFQRKLTIRLGTSLNSVLHR